MISPANNNHQKHATLARASFGEWGRNELAIIGTTCNVISALSGLISQGLPSYKIAYADAVHKNKETAYVSIPDQSGFAHYTEKISSTQINLAAKLDPFQRRTLLNNCDLVLVNGNHYSAAKQIVVIDEKKPLEKKLAQLTNVQMILLKDSSAVIPDSLQRYIPHVHNLPCFAIDDTEAIVQFLKNYLQQQTPVINGLVLSGGKSTRMGKDKGGIHYHNKSQTEHVFDLLSSYCKATFISCNAQQSAGIVDMPKTEDTFLNLGPLGGILSAFQNNPDRAWLTVACDLPFLNEETIAYLISHRNPSKMATSFWDAENKFPEPLVTIWEPRAYPLLLQFLAQGYSCPRKALINSDVEMLYPPQTLAFTNVNTTEEYEKAMIQIREEA